ncbi:MAG: RnfABCDGE type electron transport complex subunit D [Bacteroidales bacterium]|nr:RnfABCDGE type electron transport complex subunit D [Bacteroidales bacterium]MBN2761522.1 RnfABCDGE type electron transport complex subunit D [Bacteroidales bacterium]
MSQLLTISPSPHVFGQKTVKSLMTGVIIALIPTFLMSVFIFGIGTLIVTSVAVVTCVLTEYLIQKYLMHTETRIGDGSAIVTGLLLAFNLPSNLPWWIIILGSVFAIGIGKMVYGGLGNNPFNPAIVGRVFLLISFPVQMTSWPLPIASRMQYVNAITGATPLGIMKEGLRNGEALTDLSGQIPGHMELFLGHMSGSLGEVSAIALLLGFVWLLYKRIITWHIPVVIIATVFSFTGILWLIDPVHNASPVFHILTGGLMIGAIFMATDLVTSPMTKAGMILYALGIGIITVVIRVFGAYPEGVSFAILIMNAFVPLINRTMKPKRFGKEVKYG